LPTEPAACNGLKGIPNDLEKNGYFDVKKLDDRHFDWQDNDCG
jgi:hypothetical protein